MSALSTGQRQKMNFARGLLNDPWILFLDEPTLGLDVSAARPSASSSPAGRPRCPGRTVLLTTHYMVEADELCERIAIVDRGRVLAIGTPAELKQRVQRESIFRIELDRLVGRPAALARLPGVVSATAATATGGRAPADPRQTVEVNLVLVEDAALGGVVGALGGLGSRILALRKSEPTLEEVFVELVGRGFDEEQPTGRDAGRPTPSRSAPTGGHGRHEPGEPEPEERRMTARAFVGARPPGPRAAADWSRRRILSPTTSGASSAGPSRGSAGWPASRPGCSSRSPCRS